MNTRVQVEHCVTEMVTGIDIVKEGIRAAAGEPLSYHAGRRRARAATRSSAASTPRTRRRTSPPPRARSATTRSPPAPACASTPASARAARSRRCTTRWSRKLIVWDGDREAATQRMIRALDEYEIEGLTTLIPFHDALLGTEQWANAETCKDLVEDKDWLKSTRPPFPPPRADGRRRERWRPSSSTTPSRSPAGASTSTSSARAFGGVVVGGAARAAGRRQEGQAQRAQGQRRGRSRPARVAAPGQHVEGRRRGGPERRGGPAPLHHRGDEDGERDHRPQGGRDQGAPRSRRAPPINAGDPIARIVSARRRRSRGRRRG